MKVFIWFSQSQSCSTSTKEKSIQVLENRICAFGQHLMTYGFDVKVDLLVKHHNEAEWGAWIDKEMSQADWIICVCSKSSYNPPCLINGVEAANPYTLHITRQNQFSSKAMYNRLQIDAILKVIPVILLREDDNLIFVPLSLRDPSNVHRIFDDVPFNMNGDFIRLVCRIASIDRAAVSANDHSCMHQGGFVKLPSKVPPSLVDKNESARQCPSIHNDQTFMPSSVTHKQLSDRTAIDHNMLQHTTATERNIEGYNSNPLHIVSPISTGCVTKTLKTSLQHQNLQKADNSKHSTVIPINNNSNQCVELPNKDIPANSLILWKLSLEINEWKFIGRFLDLSEEIIEEIDQYTVPNKTRDKALKVLTEWVNRSPDPTWKALGEALQEAEYLLLYEKLIELFKQHL